jgi:hypothetical protein
MFLIRYSVVMLYCICVYNFSRSNRSFNNWLFDYISSRQQASIIKNCGIQWLLLDFEDSKNTESLKTCLEEFNQEIFNSRRLSKICLRIRNSMKE